MKIVVLDSYVTNPDDMSWEPVRALGELTVYERTSFEESDLITERIGDAEIVIVSKTPISKQTIDKCPCIRLIATLSTGYNVVLGRRTAGGPEGGLSGRRGGPSPAAGPGPVLLPLRPPAV